MAVIISTEIEYGREVYKAFNILSDDTWWKYSTLLEEVFESVGSMHFYCEMTKHGYASIDVDRQKFGEICKIHSITDEIAEIIKTHIGDFLGNYDFVGQLVDVARFDLGFELKCRNCNICDTNCKCCSQENS